MGGKEGSKGYLYQAIACVLGSIKEDNWSKVHMEPSTSEDKVDIAFEYEDGGYKVIQVKSSINNFTTGDIFNWFKKLIMDVPNATEYSLILIGTCSNETKREMNCINKFRDIKKDKATIKVIDNLDCVIEKVKDKLSIQLYNDDINSFEASIMNEFNRFLTDNGFTVDYYTLQLIVGAVNYQFNKFSTGGNFVTKEKFTTQILEWVSYCYPNVGKGNKRKVDLEVQYYIDNEFCNEVIRRKINYSNWKYVSAKKEEMLELYKQISEIKLGCKREEQVSNNTQSNGLLKNLSIFQLTHEHCEYSDKDKNEISEKTFLLLGITIERDFFNVGNLIKERSMVISPLLTSSPNYQGTEIEIDKYKKLNSYWSKLDKLEGIIDMLNFLSHYNIIPLVLRNVGQSYDEKIKVLIKLPREVKLLCPSEFKQPQVDVVKNFTGDNSILNAILKQKADSKVAESETSFLPTPQYRNPITMKVQDDIDILYSNYQRYLGSLFNFVIHKDNPDYMILEYEFKELKPKENIAFPSYLLVQADSDFKIKYKITSKNLSDVQTGELQYIIG
jgi:hypothetical protein